MKLEFAYRCQLGRLHGYEKADLYEIPKKIEVEGTPFFVDCFGFIHILGAEGVFGIGVGNSYTRLRFPGIGTMIGICALYVDP